jgi:hypothetical protein
MISDRADRAEFTCPVVGVPVSVEVRTGADGQFMFAAGERTFSVRVEQ